MRLMLDALLLPRVYYKSMSVSKRTFFYSVLVVGTLLVGYPFIFEKFRLLFLEKTLFELLFNTALTMLLIVILGFSDIMVFCLPIADLLKFISRKSGGTTDKLLFVKFVKV